MSKVIENASFTDVTLLTHPLRKSGEYKDKVYDNVTFFVQDDETRLYFIKSTYKNFIDQLGALPGVEDFEKFGSNEGSFINKKVAGSVIDIVGQQMITCSVVDSFNNSVGTIKHTKLAEVENN